MNNPSIQAAALVKKDPDFREFLKSKKPSNPHTSYNGFRPNSANTTATNFRRTAYSTNSKMDGFGNVVTQINKR